MILAFGRYTFFIFVLNPKKQFPIIMHSGNSITSNVSFLGKKPNPKCSAFGRYTFFILVLLLRKSFPVSLHSGNSITSNALL